MILEALKGLRAGALMLRKATLPTMDQAIVSSTNFLTSLLFARSGESGEYGIYVLVFSGILLIQSIQTALLISPMTTLGAPLMKREATEYFGSLSKSQIVLSFCSLFIAFLLYRIFFADRGGLFLLALCMVAFFWQGQEFLRRILFTRLRLKAAFLNDCVSYGSQLLVIILLSASNRLTLVNVLLIMGLSSMAALAMGLFQCRDLLDTHARIRTALKKNVDFGKWLFGSSLLIWTSTNAFNYLTAMMIGTTGPAVMQACANVLGPTNIVLSSMESIVPVMAAKKYHSQGEIALGSFIRSVCFTICGIMILYTIVVGLFSKDLLNLIYKGKYSNYSYLIWFVGATYILSSFMRVKAIGLRSILRTKGIFQAYFVSSLVTLVSGVPLVRFAGIQGAVVGSMVSAGTTALIVFFVYRREMARLERT